MTNRSKWEEAGHDAAMEAGGEIIEGMIEAGYGTDLNEWPEDAFPGFVAAIVQAYADKVQELCASGEAPF